MANETNEPNKPEPPSAVELNKATGEVVKVLEKMPGAAQRLVLRSAHTLLGLDAGSPPARSGGTQQRSQQNQGNQRGGRSS